MASPTQIPPPRARIRHSFAGPVVLIIIGVLFLLGNLGVLDMESLAHWFAHYWPVILIFWGVLKLLEYYQAQREGMRSPGIGVGGICLLVMLICFGLAATQASRVDWESFRDHAGWDDDFFQDSHLFGQAYTFSDEVTQTFPSGATLDVNDDRGNISIQGSDDNQIKIVIGKKLRARDQKAADKYDASTKPQITASGGVVTLNANTQGAGNDGVATDMTISLPRKATIAVYARHGDVSITGRDGDVDVNDSHGTVSATDIDGKVNLNLDQSSARLSQIASDVSVHGHATDVSLDGVKGIVQLDGEFMESVKMANIAKSVSFKSPRTDIEFSRLDGDLDLDSGDLQANNLSGPLRLNTRSKDIRLNGVAGDVRLQNENGTVEVHVKKLGSMEVDNHQGDIQIYLPEKAGFQVDARARDGEVKSDFPELKINNGNDEATATGSVDGGGPHLVLNNENGTIEIRKASVTEASEEPPQTTKAPRVPRAPATPKIPAPTEN